MPRPTWKSRDASFLIHPPRHSSFSRKLQLLSIFRNNDEKFTVNSQRKEKEFQEYQKSTLHANRFYYSTPPTEKTVLLNYLNKMEIKNPLFKKYLFEAWQYHPS